MIYLYAIVRHSSIPLPDRTGLMDEPLERIQVGEVDVVISYCSAPYVEPTEENLWIHEGVIEALMKKQCALPVRYNTCVSDLETLEEIMFRNLEAYYKDLQRLEGCVELGIRILPSNNSQHSGASQANRLALSTYQPDRQCADRSSGQSYLTSRLAQKKVQDAWEQSAAELARSIHHKVLEKAREGVQRIQVHPIPMITGAYLVEKGALHAIQQLIGRLREEHQSFEFLCTGPWPPYHFVTQQSTESLLIQS